MKEMAKKLLLSKGCPSQDVQKETEEFITQLEKMSRNDGVDPKKVLTIMYYTNLSYTAIILNKKSEVI
jgi:hypothetical protein